MNSLRVMMFLLWTQKPSPQRLLLCHIYIRHSITHRQNVFPRRRILASIDQALATYEQGSELSALYTMPLILLANPVLQIRRLNPAAVRTSCKVTWQSCKSQGQDHMLFNIFCNWIWNCKNEDVWGANGFGGGSSWNLWNIKYVWEAINGGEI